MDTAIKNICLIETAGHGEVLRSLVLCFLEGGFSVNVISNDQNLDFLNGIHAENLKWVEFEEESVSRFWKELEKKGNLRILFITMPRKKHLDKLGMTLAQSGVLLHNMNYSMAPFSHTYFLKRPMKGLRSLIRFIKYLPEILWERKALMTKFEKGYYPATLTANNKFIPLHLSYPELAFVVPKGDWVVGIPGSVDGSRDYGLVLSVLDEISKEKGQEIRVELLGKLRQKAKNIWKDGAFPHLQIRYYEEHLNYVDFSNKMMSTSFLIAPIRAEKDYRGILEWKGKTNITGVENDAIRYGKVCFLPSFYPSIGGLEGLFRGYEGGEDLKIQILDLLAGNGWPKEEEMNDQLQAHRRAVVLHNTTVI